MTNHTASHNYRGKHGKRICETTADIAASAISNSMIPIGAAINTSYVTFSLSASEENGTGRVRKVMAKITNGTSSPITEGMRLWLFNTAPTSQTSGTALSGMDTSMTYCYGYIDLKNAVQMGTYNSMSFTDCEYSFVCATENNQLFGILEATSDTTFDAIATINLSLIIEQD